MKTPPASSNPEPAGTAKPDAPRTPDGRFSSLDAGVLPPPTALADDPLLAGIGDLSGTGFTAGPAGDPPTQEEEANAEEAAAEEAGEAEGEPEPEVDPLLTDQALASSDAAGSADDAPAAPAGELDDAGMVAALMRRDPELAKQFIDRIASGKKGDQDAPATTPKIEALRARWNKAVKEGRDFDAVLEIAGEISRSVAQEASAPLLEAQRREQEHQKTVREQAKAFTAFAKANPGWEAHRKAMRDELAAIARDFGPQVAAATKPEVLLRRVAPDFKPAKGAKAPPAPARSTSARPLPQPGASTPAAPAAAGPAGKESADQVLIRKTVARMQYDARVKNIW